MGDTTSGSEDMITANGFIGTPSGEEATSETKVVGGGPLKKGPWTSGEDAILVEYVRKHGEGNWNAVQKHSGLSRCGKSCRLRWANHLRPDLKKGAFSPEEERRIIELHCKMGNKWARMAAELPGRTDNEIKNFWNTRIKRRQRAGLPIYPSDLCLQTSNENQQSQSMATFPSGNTSFPELFQTEIFEIPATEIVNLELTHQLHLPKILDVHNMLDIPPASSFLARGLGPSYSKRFRFSPMDPPNRLCGLECLLPDSSGGDVSAAFNQYQNYDYYLNANDPSSLGLLPGEDGLLNLISASEPIHWATKLELPSLQYSDTQAGSWGKMSSPLPPLESVDTLIHSSPAEHTQLARNSGLLDAVLYPAQNNSLHQFSNASVMGGEVLVDSLPHNLLDAEWGSYGYPLSPRGQSAASDFSAYTPISGTSLDEPQPVDTMPRSEVKKEAVDWAFSDYSAKYDDILNGDFLSRPDMFLGANCFGPYTDRDREN